MRNSEFQIWLQGFFELSNVPLTRQMIFVVRNHLQLVKAYEGAFDSLNEAIFQKSSSLINDGMNADSIALFHQWLKREIVGIDIR